MSGSAVVALERRVPRIILKLPRPPPPLEQGGRLAVQDEEDGQEDALVTAERTWFAKRLREGLTRTRGVLRAIKNDALDGGGDGLERLMQLTSLRAVVEALPGVPGDVFRSWFSDEEWLELEASEASIASESQGRLRTLRLKRQKQLLDESCEFAIDLTVRDADEVGEQSILVQGCTTAVQVLLSRVGMNARGTVKCVVKERPEKELALVVAKEKESSKARRASRKRPRKESARDDGADEDLDMEEELKEQPKRAAKAARAVEDNVPAADDEVDADGDNEDEGPIAVPSKEDAQKAAKNGDFGGDDEDEDDEEMEWRDLFERARQDVALVTAMMKEAAVAGVTLQVGAVRVPDSKLACEAAGKVLWDDEEKLKRCLASSQGDDGGSAVERWGALLKWWRVVERSFSVTGLFAHLRGMRKGKKTLAERYAVLVKRLKAAGKVLSFKQAEKYDRLGKFLLRFPRLVFQLQLVSLADWLQKVGAKVLMDSLESLLDEEQLQFWRESVPLVEEPQRAEVVAERTTAAADVGNVWAPRHYDEELDPSPDRAISDFSAAGDHAEHGAGKDLAVFDAAAAGQALRSLAAGRSNVSSHEEEEEEARATETCPKCATTGKVVFLACDAAGKGHNFCWKCAGYSSPPPDELNYPGSGDVSIRTYVFCAAHLELECCTRPYELYAKKAGGRGDRLFIGDYVNRVQAEEARHIVRIFSDPNSQFSIVPIDPNGWCMFVSIARALALDWAGLVREMKTFAAQYLKGDENTVAMDDPQEVRRLWRQLDPRKASSVQAFWSSEAGDFLIPMLAAHLNAANAKAVQLCVWMIEKGVLEMTKLVYPDGRAEEFLVVVDLLKSNGVVEHYDLMRRR